jgi:hypothetical protein
VGNSLVVDENYGGEMHHFLNRVRQWDTNNAPWLLEAEGVITILDAFYRSDKTGQAINIQMR